VDADGRVGTGRGALVLSEVQMAGKRALTGAEMLRGLRPTPGEHFE
jgi:methionyl-tRNA formyltransferase